MRFTYRSTRPLEGIRPLMAQVESSSMQVDLERDYEVGSEREVSASPLHLLLGLAADSPTRLLDMAVWGPGYDWACVTVGRELPAVGATVTGQEACDTVGEAVAARSSDIEALTTAATTLGSVNHRYLTPEVDGPLEDLSRLLESIRIVPSDLAGPSGAMVMAAESDDLVALAAFELLRRTDEQGPLKPCGHCGCLFAPVERADEEYCRRPAPGEPLMGDRRTCQKVGPQRRYAETVDDLTARYRAEYKRLDKRQRRGLFARDQLDAWREEAKRLLAAAKDGDLSADAYGEQLEKIQPEEK